MEEWNWFLGKQKKEIERPKQIDYRSISRDKNLVLDLVMNDPNVLFKVVGSENACMCAGTCGSCEYEDVILFDYILEARTITDQDLYELGKMCKLNWFKISSKVPLSNRTLWEHVNEVDWDFISKSCLYTKTYEFCKQFHDKLIWSNTKHIHIFESGIEDAMRFIPFDVALGKKLLPLDYLQKNIGRMCLFPMQLVESYTIKEIESLEDCNESNIQKALMECADVFALKCCQQHTIPIKYPEILGQSRKYIKQVISECPINEEFINKYLIDILDQDSWLLLSQGKIQLSDEFVVKHKDHLSLHHLAKWKQFDWTGMQNIPNEVLCKYQKLSPEYIDQYAEVLDWYSLCEYQELPEWLIRKHIDKINWGQISAYQCLSHEFIQEYRHQLNMIKLESNTKSRAFK